MDPYILGLVAEIQQKELLVGWSLSSAINSPQSCHPECFMAPAPCAASKTFLPSPACCPL
jgi:hypothetical protein